MQAKFEGIGYSSGSFDSEKDDQFNSCSLREQAADLDRGIDVWKF
jgi:hypothetical protein